MLLIFEKGNLYMRHSGKSAQREIRKGSRYVVLPLNFAAFPQGFLPWFSDLHSFSVYSCRNLPRPYPVPAELEALPLRKTFRQHPQQDAMDSPHGCDVKEKIKGGSYFLSSLKKCLRLANACDKLQCESYRIISH